MGLSDVLAGQRWMITAAAVLLGYVGSGAPRRLLSSGDEEV